MTADEVESSSCCKFTEELCEVEPKTEIESFTQRALKRRKLDMALSATYMDLGSLLRPLNSVKGCFMWQDMYQLTETRDSCLPILIADASLFEFCFVDYL